MEGEEEGEEEKNKGDDDDGGNNSDDGAKRWKKMRGDIDRPASKGDNEDDEHNFGVRGEEGA